MVTCTSETEQVSKKALEWCAANKGWKRICDIEDVDSLYITWEELPNSIKDYWISEHSEDPESAWKGLGEVYCKVPKGFITEKGKFFKNLLEAPLKDEIMMVFKVE